MRCEMPEIKRCCVCIPLRYGLIVWGYINLAYFFLSICGTIEEIVKIVNKEDNDSNIYIDSVILMLTIVEFFLIIIFIVAAHMKNAKILKVFFIGNITLWILYSLYLIGTIFYGLHLLYLVYNLHNMYPDIVSWLTLKKIIWSIVKAILPRFCLIIFQFYAMLLLRNEIKKLERNNGRFRFVNNAAEAECTMECEEQIADEEKGIEDTILREERTPEKL